MNDDLVQTLTEVASERTFDAGETVRVHGSFAPDMLFVLEGEAEVLLNASEKLTIGRNSLIGEMGYLSGHPANAKVRALTPLRTIVLDRNAIGELEIKHPDKAIALHKELARTVAAREAQNAVLLSEEIPEDAPLIEVRRCVNEADLLLAQQTRYAVYCGEFNRPSPNADHIEKVIVDELDTHGTSFLAESKGEVVGTVRVNLAKDGDLNILPKLYGMIDDPDHPEHTCIVTKYAIREPFRGGTTYIRLFAAIAGFVVQGSNAKKLYIDCVPKLARFYATMGFKRSEEDFFHYENGLSVPMCLDVIEYCSRKSIEERIAQNRWR